MPALRSLSRNVALLLVGRIGEGGMGLLLGAAVATLGPEELGTFYFARSAAGLVVVLADLGLSRYAIASLASAPSDSSPCLGTLLGVRIILNGVALLATIAVVGVLGLAAELRVATITMVAAALARSLADLTLDAWRARQQFRRAITLGLLGKSATLALALVGIACGHAVDWVVSSALVGNIVFAIVCVALARRRFGRWQRAPGASGLLRDVRRLAWFSAVPILAALNARIGIGVLMAQRGAAALGEYGAAVQVVEATLLFAFSINTAALPSLVRRGPVATRAWQEMAGGLLLTSLALGTAISATLSFASAWIVGVVYGSDYVGAAYILRIAAWSTLAIFVSSAVTTLLQSLGRQRTAGLLVLPLCATHLVLAAGLVPRWGGLGAAWALTLAEALTVAIHLAVVARIVSLPQLARSLFAAPEGQEEMTVRGQTP